MNCFAIEGGSRLEGQVRVSGAKNSALKLMAASLLARGHTVLYNVPRISDVFTMAEMLERLGVIVSFEEDVVWIDTSGDLSTEAPYDLVRRMRASRNVLGPLLARSGHARVAMPGGCRIGNRAIDMHEGSLNQLGVTFTFDHGYLEGIAPRLIGKRVVLEFPSRGATENLLTAAVLAEGVTTIENAAREPDIVDLASFLNLMGAKVQGAGTSTIRVTGVKELSSTDYTVSPDPIEAGTFALAALVTGGEVELVGARAGDMDMFLEKVVKSGAEWSLTESGIHVSIDRRPKAVDFSTLPYPGFPTDLQAQMMGYLSVAEGTSIVTENVFESRFLHVNELARMGADIRVEGHHAVVKGVAGLQGAPVHAPDLRGGAALVIAALVAEGRTEIHDFFHVERGYENLPGKLRALGANVDGRTYVGRRRFKPTEY